MMDNRSYSLSRDEMKNESLILEYEGYQVNPKIKNRDSIEVSKIIFVNDMFSEKIIRRKIDKKINYLLEQLRIIDGEDNPDEDGVGKCLMDAEKLRIQIINNYVKYLGHTYQSLTLKKIQIIINQLRFKLYTIKDIERQNMMIKNMLYDRDENTMEYGEREGRRGR